MRKVLPAILPLSFLAAVGCANDPLYIDPMSGPTPMPALEGGMRDMAGNLVEAKGSLVLPVKTETMNDAMKRATRQALLDPAVEIPYIKVGDIEVSVEWTIKNLDPMPAQAKIQLNGANQFFSYDPATLVLSNDPEAPPTPGLQGDIPLEIAGNGELSGLFREDEIREASIDLDQITRGNTNPFRATLTISKNATSYDQLTPMMLAPPDQEPPPQMSTGIVFPREAFPQMLRIDIVFKPEAHMTLEYSVRVRDTRGVLADKLLDSPAGELQPFAPMEFTVAAATP